MRNLRDIRFRAWSALDNKMYVCDMEEDIQDYFKHDDGISLMQYTGLKDMNGKEIYEGDILKRDNSDHPMGDYVSDVIWSKDKACWMLKDAYCSGQRHLWRHANRMEVIGNIFENPNLLNG